MNWKIFLAPIVAGLLAAGLAFVIYGSNPYPGLPGFSLSFWLTGEFLSGFVITLVANEVTGLFMKPLDLNTKKTYEER